MVMGLHLPFHSSPLDGMSAKSTSLDSGMFQSLSFDEILKGKEKQLQQEQSVSASSVAAALANLHTLFMTQPSIPEIETIDNSIKVDVQSGSQGTNSPLTSHSINSSTSLDGLSQFAMNTPLTVDQPSPSQTATKPPVLNELPVSEVDQTTPAGLPEASATQPVAVEDAQLPAMNFSKPQIPVPTNTLTQAMNIAEKSEVKTGSTVVSLNNIASELVSTKTRTQVEEPVIEAKHVVPQIPTTEATIEIPYTTAAINPKNDAESVQGTIKSQSSANAKTSPQTLASTPLPSQAETKDVKPEQTIGSQPVEVGEFPTGKTIILESNVKDAIDKSVLPSGFQAEVSRETSVPASPVRVEVNQGLTPWMPEQTEGLINTPALEIQTLDATPAQEPATQTDANKKLASSSSNTSEIFREFNKPRCSTICSVRSCFRTTFGWSDGRRTGNDPPNFESG